MKIFDFEISDFWKLLRPPLIQFSKFNNFLWGCWFLGKNLSNFVPPVWKLHNPYCHTGIICPLPIGIGLTNLSKYGSGLVLTSSYVPAACRSLTERYFSRSGLNGKMCKNSHNLKRNLHLLIHTNFTRAKMRGVGKFRTWKVSAWWA